MKRAVVGILLVILLVTWWVCVGIYSFYFMQSSSFITSNKAATKARVFLKVAPTTLIHERKDTPLTYPMCKQITNLPTSLDPFDCGFNLMEDTDYLPDYQLIERFKANRGSQVRNTAGYLDRTDYFKRVYELQNPKDCSQRTWHTVKFTSHGHGVNLFHLAVNIGDHYDRNIPVVASKSAYRYGSHKEICYGKTKVNRGWSCHLSPLSQTCAWDDDDETALDVVNWSHLGKAHAQKEWCKPNGVYRAEYGRCKCDPGYLPTDSGTTCASYETDHTFREKNKWKHRFNMYHDDDDYAMRGTEHWISRNAPGEIFASQNVRDPATWRYHRFKQAFPSQDVSRLKLKYGFFWWILQNSWLLHKDSPRREEMETKTRALLFPEGNGREQCIAVQVRRGDSCHDATAPHRTCPKLQVYVDRVDLLKQKYKITKPITIYLASDDPSAIEEAKALQTDDVWVWQPISRQRYVNGKVVDNNPALFEDEAMDELYYDLWAISACELGFVTSFASSVAWNAYAMAVGRFGYYIPFISVDLPWGHKILGEHHARNNLFDGTVDESELNEDRDELLHI